MAENWKYLHELKNDVNFITIDTRDFNVLETDFSESEYRLYRMKAQRKFGYGTLQKFTKEEIYKLAKNLEQMTGGKASWRFIQFKENEGIWIKYLRFLRVGENQYLGYTGPMNDPDIYLKKNYDIDDIHINFLNTH